MGEGGAGLLQEATMRCHHLVQASQPFLTLAPNGRCSLCSKFKPTGDQLIFLNCLHDHQEVIHTLSWFCGVQVKIVTPTHTSCMKHAFPYRGIFGGFHPCDAWSLLPPISPADVQPLLLSSSSSSWQV